TGVQTCALPILDAPALQRPHVDARDQQGVSDADRAFDRRGLMRGGQRSVDERAVLAAEIGDQPAPAVERDPRVPARDPAIGDLAVAVAATQLDRAGVEREGARGRGATREHHHDARPAVWILTRVVTAGAGGGGVLHAPRQGYL